MLKFGRVYKEDRKGISFIIRIIRMSAHPVI